MLLRTRTIAAISIVFIGLVAGCDILLLHDYGYEYDDGGTGTPEPLDDPVVDSYLFRVTTPAGEAFATGSALTIRWEGAIQPEVLDIDLYVAGVPKVRLAAAVANAGSFTWHIPTDFPVHADVFDEYRIVVSGFLSDDSTGALLLAAYSADFSILPSSTGGLSDITVGTRLVDATLTDNGAVIDGDTVDVYLNGSAVVMGHVLTGEGTTFPLSLRSGENLLEVYAVNEGTASPNTALVEFSDVVEGASAQEWRLLTGETGRLTITAP